MKFKKTKDDVMQTIRVTPAFKDELKTIAEREGVTLTEVIKTFLVNSYQQYQTKNDLTIASEIREIKSRI